MRELARHIGLETKWDKRTYMRGSHRLLSCTPILCTDFLVLAFRRKIAVYMLLRVGFASRDGLSDLLRELLPLMLLGILGVIEKENCGKWQNIMPIVSVDSQDSTSPITDAVQRQRRRRRECRC